MSSIEKALWGPANDASAFNGVFGVVEVCVVMSTFQPVFFILDLFEKLPFFLGVIVLAIISGCGLNRFRILFTKICRVKLSPAAIKCSK